MCLNQDFSKLLFCLCTKLYLFAIVYRFVPSLRLRPPDTDHALGAQKQTVIVTNMKMIRLLTTTTTTATTNNNDKPDNNT